MTLQIRDVLEIVTFVFILVFSTGLLIKKGGNRKANIFLAIFLLSKALCLYNMLVMTAFSSAAYNHAPYLFYTGSSFTILWGPLLYFYVKSLTWKDFQFKPVHLLHFIPFFADVIHWMFRFHFHTIAYKQEFLSTGRAYSNMNYIWLLYAYIIISVITYIILSIINIHHYHKAIKENSSALEKTNLSWLYIVLYGFTAKWIFDVLFYLQQWVHFISPNISIFMSMLLLFIFITLLVFKSILQSELIYKIEEKPKYSQSKLTKDEIEAYLSKLSKYMADDKPYLIPSLTLTDLADKIAISPRYLSQIINETLNQNFYDYINSYRIEESKRILEISKPKRTVLEILYQVGFNSKSAFNSAFKQNTGMTPTEFIKTRQFT